MKDTKKQDSRGLWFLLIGAVSALLCFAVTGAVLILSEVSPLIPVIVGCFVLCAAETLIAFLYVGQNRPEESEDIATVEKMTNDVLQRLSGLVVIVQPDGTYTWRNNEMKALLSKNENKSKTLADVIDVPMADILKADTRTGCEVTMFGVHYRVRSYMMPVPNMDFWMLFFEDRTDYLSLQETLSRESPVIVYAVLDNIDKISQSARAASRDASNRIEQILTEWARSLDGFIREYDRDKYMIQFPMNRLAGCVEDGFSVLNDIREATGAGSVTPLTVSMGISACGRNVSERENDAVAALETALQRGGDQVVLRENGGHFSYFGGKTKTDISHTRIATRTAGGKIADLIRNAGNVLIMGHARPDFDSIGSCIGLYRLAQAFHDDVRIVIDRHDPNYIVSTEALLAKQPEYDRVFISGEEGMELIRSDTLLLVADVNNMGIVECPELVRNVATQVVIDHHRKLTDFDIQPVIAIIEPGTSSASELVSEILEFADASNVEKGDSLCLTPEEANVMLSGIMLDTKNFTRCTGEETYAAAMYLRTHGADAEKVRTFFSSDEVGFAAEARLSANARRFRDRILLTGEHLPENRDIITAQDKIIVSRVAETLLTLKNVDAAFAMFYSDHEVIISARSNGQVNVQLILESLGGGGRYDAAGAQLQGSSFQVVSENLKAAINAYLDGTLTKTEEKPAAPKPETGRTEKSAGTDTTSENTNNGKDT